VRAVSDNRWSGLALVMALLGCGKSHAASSHIADAPKASGALADCGHAVCGENYVLDAAVGQDCSAGARCLIALKLVATGDFHVNDQYPYRFKAEATSGIEFLGTDATGKNVFSKPAGDWVKSDAKSGIMTVQLTPTMKGRSTISGIFKLSVCSAQNCLIEQPQVRVALAAR
jgi:hypothetical protein